ncbi:MAG TPA: hypothetical protein ENJ84_03980 [Gammaproteobacteria bacterium]|nr:hypothetical protein [Gammaproteobacteria bacterium]
MSSKAEKIQELIDMQKKFIAYEHEHGVEAVDYFAPKEGHPLDGFRQDFNSKAMDLVDIAHAEVGSHR